MSFDYFRPNPKPAKTEKKTRKPVRKRGKHYRAASLTEKERMARLKTMPCIACRSRQQVEVHHITQGGRRLGHEFTLCLCHECHEGKFSIGNAKKSFIMKYGTELELLGKVNKLLNEG